MFKKLVIIEPINMLDVHIKELNNIAESIVMFDNIPIDDDEIVARINDADIVLLSYTSSHDTQY